MIKTYVLDTNIILHDCSAIFNFGSNDVVIPIPAIEELDKFKSEQNELGRNARFFSRTIDELRKTGSLKEGVNLGSGLGKLYVKFSSEKSMENTPIDLDSKKIDIKILTIAKELNAILVTRDVNLRLIADVLGVPCEDYEHGGVRHSNMYTGTRTLDVCSETINAFYKNNEYTVDFDDLSPNEYVLLRDINNHKSTALTKYNSTENKLLPVFKHKDVFGLSPKNLEQVYLLDCLMNPEIQLVTVSGMAGSGKTVCAVAAALHQVLETGTYKKVLFTKPVISVNGSDSLGFLPGTLSEKLAPWMSSFYDNIEFLMESPKATDAKKPKTKKGQKSEDFYDEKAVGKTSAVSELMLTGAFEIGALDHLRGRTLPQVLIILDEAQNVSKHVIKTLVTRAGFSTKIIALADVQQVDSPYLSADNNGFVYLVEKFKDKQIHAHVTLSRGERSELATIAAEIL